MPRLVHNQFLFISRSFRAPMPQRRLQPKLQHAGAPSSSSSKAVKYTQQPDVRSLPVALRNTFAALKVLSMM
ncbi:hypothetical protein BDZ89DRAFT_1056761 [Hymenopellis radicata]|nr:hypothetical protein BDZ89DRAFT_1056761 [Hymenopellis radicata]